MMSYFKNTKKRRFLHKRRHFHGRISAEMLGKNSIRYNSENSSEFSVIDRTYFADFMNLTFVETHINICLNQPEYPLTTVFTVIIDTILIYIYIYTYIYILYIKKPFISYQVFFCLPNFGIKFRYHIKFSSCLGHFSRHNIW